MESYLTSISICLETSREPLLPSSQRPWVELSNQLHLWLSFRMGRNSHWLRKGSKGRVEWDVTAAEWPLLRS